MTFPSKTAAELFILQMSEVFPLGDDVAVIPTTHGHWAITSKSALTRLANICAICGQAFNEYPNNPQPVAEGECCAYCDDHVVTPARIAMKRSAS